jgi:hypothetical protein
MADESTRLKLPYILANQAQKHVTHNEAIRLLDALVQLAVTSRSLATPPGSPSDGALYIVASGGTGAWSGWDLNSPISWMADGQNWSSSRWRAWVQDEGSLVVWTGAAWEAQGLPEAGAEIQNAALIGLGTTATTANPLAAKLNAALLTAKLASEGGNGNVVATLNKEAASDDGGLTLQTGFSSRALLGLLGDDDFTVKVSPNGSTFHQAITVDKDTGNVAIGAGSDANNRLLVSGQNSLFTNSGSLNVVYSKGAVGDDASFTLQTNFSTRALLGLLANNDFTLKVSPDGSTFSRPWSRGPPMAT